MLAVAGRICGLHAQVLSSAELALWARVEDLESGDVERALWRDRTLVKTWAMRGTLHLLPAREMSFWRAALSASGRYRTDRMWQRLLGITLEEMDRLTDAIAAALNGRMLTREELMREVGRISGSDGFAELALNGWGTILKPAAFTGRLCFAPSVGQRVRFTHPESWLGTPLETGDPDTATATVARRFLAAYGPATEQDLARWWGGASVAAVRRWIASLDSEVQKVDLDGASAWMLAQQVREIRDMPPARSVRLLPAFDPYVIGASRHADKLLPGDLRARVYRPQGWISAVLLVNGRMEGIWRHELKGSRVEIALEPFVKQPAWVRRAANNEAERLAAFFQAKPAVVWND